LNIDVIVVSVVKMHWTKIIEPHWMGGTMSCSMYVGQ